MQRGNTAESYGKKQNWNAKPLTPLTGLVSASANFPTKQQTSRNYEETRRSNVFGGGNKGSIEDMENLRSFTNANVSPDKFNSIDPVNGQISARGTDWNIKKRLSRFDQ